MNNDPNQATTPDLTLNNWIVYLPNECGGQMVVGIFVSVLVILCLAVACSLYILSKDYLCIANKHKAQNELNNYKRFQINREFQLMKN